MKPLLRLFENPPYLFSKLLPETDLDEVKQFLKELEQAILTLDARRIQVRILHDAEKKGFVNLEGLRLLSVRSKALYAVCRDVKLAVHRPQLDYPVPEGEVDPERFRYFTNLEEARRWLLATSP